MELLLISKDKLKVTLSALDMEKYELDCETIDYDSTETRRAFWSILDEAKHKTGFDAASDKVFIQVYPSRAGGCEMFVTRVGEKRGCGECTALGEVRCESTLVYRFENTSFAKSALNAVRPDGKAELYIDKKGAAVLVLRSFDSPRSARLAPIMEYGTLVASDEHSAKCRGKVSEQKGALAAIYIREHCKKESVR